MEIKIRKKSDRPFKSGFKTNTVKGVIEHPVLKTPAFTFNEDDSYVDCRMCMFPDIPGITSYIDLLVPEDVGKHNVNIDEINEYIKKLKDEKSIHIQVP